MVLMEMVICLHALVSVEHSDAAVTTCMVKLWRARVRSPNVVVAFFSEGGQKWKSELDSRWTLAGVVDDLSRM